MPVVRGPDRARWWRSNWFWGGVVPILPGAGIVIITTNELDAPVSLAVMLLFSAPVAALFLAAIAAIWGEALGELLHSMWRRGLLSDGADEKPDAKK